MEKKIINSEDRNHSAEEPSTSQVRSDQEDVMPLPSQSQPTASTSQAVPQPPPADTEPTAAKRARLESEAHDHHKQNIDRDDCELYAKYLACKLRKYPEAMRAIIICKIDGILADNPIPVDTQSIAYLPQASSQPQFRFTPAPPPQIIYVMPSVADTTVQLSIPETNEIVVPPIYVNPECPPSQHVDVSQPSSSSQVNPEASVTHQTQSEQMNLIEKAFWDANFM